MNMPVIKVPKPTRADLAKRRVAVMRIKGMWKDRYKEMIKENKKLRKEWSKRVEKLGW